MNKSRVATGGLLLAFLLAACGGASEDGRRAKSSVSTLTELDAAALMDWAERAYPQYFGGPSSAGQHAGYQYRHYPETDNYLGVAGDAVAVYGDLTHYTLTPVGTLSDFRCNVTPAACDLPSIEYIEPREGDYYVFDAVIADRDGEYRYTATHVYAGGGNSALRRIETAPPIPVTYSGAREGSVDGYTAGEAVCSYSPALQRTAPFPQRVGQTWSSTSRRTCSGTPSPGGETTVTGAVVAAETIITPAGTFATLKSVYTLTTTRVPGVKVIHSCWRSVALGRIVRCEEHHSAFRTTYELKAFVAAGGPPIGATAARFNGRWRLKYDGSESGTCILDEADPQVPGKLRADCSVDSGSEPFYGTAMIDDQGVLTFTISEGARRDRTYRGRFASPLQGSGEWSGPATGATGTWSATRG